MRRLAPVALAAVVALIARAQAALGEAEADSPQIRYDRTFRHFARQSRRRAV